ncbi:MAG: hypothetical protein OHK0046_44480 [Anaerolineae bacterium]
MTSISTTILKGDTHLMTSQQNGRTYRIQVNLPLGYDKSPGDGWPFNNAPAQWPIIYVLDGNWYTGLVTDMIGPMAWCGSTNDAIVVGIGYPEGHDAVDSFWISFTRRDHDLTPTPDEAAQKAMETQHQRPAPNGDAGGFLKFIQHELIPMIERDYRADPAQRILLGHSYGGLFALYALFEAPDLFQTVIAGSPTLAYGSRFTFQQEATFAENHKRLPANLCLYVGEHEESLDDTTTTDTLRMAAILQSRHYDGFTLTQRMFLGENHCEVAAPGFQWGLKQALKRA